MTVLHIIAGFLALVGLASVLHGLHVRMVTPCARGRYLFLVLDGNDAELRLKATAELFRCSPAGTYDGILAVDFGMCDEVRRACGILARESNAIEMYTAREFSERLRGKAVERMHGTDGNS